MNRTYIYIFFSIVYLFAFVLPYGLIPSVFIFGGESPIANELFNITLVSFLFYLISLNLPFVPYFNQNKIVLPYETVLYVVFGLFCFISLIVVITAPNIPLVESLKGADPDALTQNREDFLKARTGVFSVLGYLVGFVNSYFLPYMFIVALERKHRFIYLFISLFAIYSIISLEKAYFLKIGIPLFIYYFFQSENKILFTFKGIGIIVSILFLMFSLAQFTDSGLVINQADFFSIMYRPEGTVEAIVWRAAIVPIVTALDGLNVFVNDFDRQYFFGDTSSFLSYLKGSSHINFERFLYQFQFGGSETGNANQFYLIEAFINFGWFGVVLFSLFVGKIIRIGIDSLDTSYLAIIPLFIFHIFNAGLVGVFLSNGFIVFLLFILIVKLK